MYRAIGAGTNSAYGKIYGPHSTNRAIGAGTNSTYGKIYGPHSKYCPNGETIYTFKLY